MKWSSFLASLLLIAAIVGLFDVAEAIQFSDFTHVGTGYCHDSNGKVFTGPLTNPQTYTNEADMNNYCVSWCGQYIPATFLGFETTHGGPNFYCSCLFDMSDPSYTDSGKDIKSTFPHTYSPAALTVTGYPGTGAITRTSGNPVVQCYKLSSTAPPSKSPSKSPSKPPSKRPSKSPSKTPSKRPSKSPSKPPSKRPSKSVPGTKSPTVPGTKSPTVPGTESPTVPGTESPTVPGTKSPTVPGTSPVPGTKAPTKPAGSCPVGHPSCAGAANCSGTVFSHCVDGCCTNIASKSAKGTKSSKI